MLTDLAGRKVWMAEYEPFGRAEVNEDPDGDGKLVTNNLRFPGQYYDVETGLHYNWHRYYDSGTGRYLTPDPIGLMGGLNQYTYVANDPVDHVDVKGLWLEDVHHDKTYLWALAVGFTATQAERIARGDNGTDGVFGSWMPLIGDQSRHVNEGGSCDSRNYWAEVEYQRALGYLAAGNLAAALGHLGKVLHSLQDVYAHRDWSTGTSGTRMHPKWFDSWDDPRNESARALTEQKSLEYLTRFRQALSR